jgi:general secretion pathway protein N
MANTRSLSLWSFVGIITGALCALVIHLPAQWLALGIAKASQAQVQIQDARGTLWNGSGKLVFTGGQGSRDALALPGRIQWQLGVKAFAPGPQQLDVTVFAPCCMASPSHMNLVAIQGLKGLQLKVADHRSQWPADLLSGLGAPWNTLQAEGNLLLETQQLQILLSKNQTQLQGQLKLTAQNISSKLSTLRPMGTYQMKLGADSASPASPRLTLSTLSGSLLLSGQGQWQGAHFQFRGEASAVPEHAAALSNLLNIIGRRQGARSLLSLG